MSLTSRVKFVPLALGLCLAAGAMSLSSAPASAAPAGNIGASTALKNDLVQDVQWRRYGYGPYRGGYGYRGYGYRRGGAVAAGVIGGLALGAALGAAAAAPPPPAAYYEPEYEEGYAQGGDWLAYCSSKYRSFDPRSGTYLGYDGLRHPCQ